MACDLSDAREWFDQKFKGDSPASSAADQTANRFGRNNASQSSDCRKVCSKYKPNGLPARY